MCLMRSASYGARVRYVMASKVNVILLPKGWRWFSYCHFSGDAALKLGFFGRAVKIAGIAAASQHVIAAAG